MPLVLIFIKVTMACLCDTLYLKEICKLQWDHKEKSEDKIIIGSRMLLSYIKAYGSYTDPATLFVGKIRL